MGQLRVLAAERLAPVPLPASEGRGGVLVGSSPGPDAYGQADAGPVEPHAIGGNRALQNGGSFRGGELLPGGEPEDLLVPAASGG